MTALLAVVGGFASGVFLRSLFILGWPVVVFIIVLALICFIIRALLGSLHFTVLGTFFIFLAFGIVRTHVSDTPLPQTFAADLHAKVSYKGVVVADPDVREKNQRITIEIKKGSEKTKLLAVVNKDQEVVVGDHVSVYGTLLLPQPFSDPSEGGRVFHYDTYLQKDGVRFLMNYASLSVFSHAPWYSVSALCARVKHSFLNGLSSVMPPTYAALAGGVVIGGKRGLGADLQNAFIISGLIPVVVLSGYNVMVAASGLMYLLHFLKLRRPLRAAAGAAGVIVFIAIAGISSTAVRAGLMALIGLYARATGRSYAAGRALLLVLLLMLLWNPLLLVFDPGLDLSVVATAGLIWLTPLLEARLMRIQSPLVRELLATTLGAQIAVLPLLLYQTGRLSLVAIPANLIVLPFIPLLMAFSALAGLLGILFGTYAFIFGLPAFLISTYVIYVAQTLAGLPFASITFPAFSLVFVFAAYAGLIYVASSKRFSITPQFTFSKKASI